MGLSFEEVLAATRSWDAVYFGVMFVAATIYAYWPRNKTRFDQAAQIPLKDDSSDV